MKTISTYELNQVYAILRRKNGQGSTEAENILLQKYYSQEKFFPFILLGDGPACNLDLVRKMQGDPNDPETKHARIITSRGEAASTYSLKCKYRDGKEFTLRGDKYGWEPKFQFNALVKYVDQKWKQIHYATMFCNSRPAPYDWVYKWNTITGEYQENSIMERSNYPGPNDTHGLKPAEKERIIRKYNTWFGMNQTPCIAINSEDMDQQKQSA